MSVDESQRMRGRRGVWAASAIAALLALAVLGVVAAVVVDRAGPILKGRVVETLSTHFNSRVELEQLDVAVLGGLRVTGRGLRIFPPDDVVAAGATQPLIAIDHLSFHANVLGLFFKPMHVGAVHVSGVVISIPPRETRKAAARRARHGGKIKIVVEEIVCDDSRLVLGTAKRGKEPKTFALERIVLHNVGPAGPWRYDATLINAIPRGAIHASGRFGPWNTEAPGESSVAGSFTFDHADLGTIRGIGGTLSSAGDFTGKLDQIVVEGRADVPNFELDTARHPMSLRARYKATVDGTSGDTYLRSVNARLAGSELQCSGAVVNSKGLGHSVDLDVYVPEGRVEDFLKLAVKTTPPVVTGLITTRVKLHVRAGHESVMSKLGMQADFVLQQIHFTNSKVEEKVGMLSVRAQGEPKRAKPGVEEARSRMQGSFVMEAGKLNFDRLLYTLPGAAVQLQGVYSLDGQQFDFRGKVRTEAKLSQMVASRWKSWLLKAADPFFQKHGAGAEIPVRITGTQSAPKFGLDFERW